MKKTPKIYDFQDFVEVVDNCSYSHTIVKAMSFRNFKKWPSLTTDYQIKKLNPVKPLLKNMVEITAKRGETHLYYKEKFNGGSKILFFIPKTKLSMLAEAQENSEDRGITDKRKQTILTHLGDIIPLQKKSFGRTWQ
ncbi:unnamed protein product [Psylliodes chrysocephalus]|uniref:Uncharacterized protein n=1 Tax=Psylliodes chrysocephalus TaxID=3402493 RepID=A0A9P0D279_9CUCU|nr:unnamed protein product [Psylliodes chrysocephala]